MLVYRRWTAVLGLLLLASASSLRAAANYGPWEPTHQKASLMIVAAHPDDESIFFGGTLPYYAGARHMQVATVDMVTDYASCMPDDLRGRKEELRNATWHSGVRMAPVFGDFYDHTSVGAWSSIDAAWDAWDGNLTDGVADKNSNGIPDGREAGARFIARQIREFRPEVVLSHDLAGEYGHGAHKATAICSVDAFALAADPSVDIDGLPAWSAKKLYLHLYGQHPLFHTGWETPLAELGGKTARQVADESAHMHVTQNKPDVSTYYRHGENYDGLDSELWGLYASRVGWDPTPTRTAAQADLPGGYALGDFFANIEELDPDTYRLGDANFDGTVNFDDLVIVAQHYNKSNTPLRIDAADFDLDGKTDFADLVVLAQHYLTTLTPTNIEAPAFLHDWALAQALMPEPTSSLFVVAFAGSALAGRKRRAEPHDALPTAAI